jgi:hypothetical protein
MSQRTLHLVMIATCGVLALAGLLTYTFAPTGREAAGLALMTGAFGMIGGKMSNGFGLPGGGLVAAMRAPKPQETTEGEADDHDH